MVESGVLTDEDAENLEQEFESKLEEALEAVKAAEQQQDKSKFAGSTAVFQPSYSHEPVDTAVPKERARAGRQGALTTPGDFRVQPKVKRTVLDRRAQAFKNGGPFDWAFAEALAFGSLLLEKTPVRLSGQDSRRGTFCQRHAVLYDAETRERYIPLMNITPDQARFCVYNSLLSEAGVLGFDYGYSLDFPEMLCMWEAQFGDFANGAQVIIDQFIASAESKWQRPSGIVLLLPHGYEGQGPEHSSARLERFLQLCAEDNIQVCNLTTPAQYFHVLRRQMRRHFRKPLVIMTPKSLLRAEQCVSTLEDFTSGAFPRNPARPLQRRARRSRARHPLLGKIYYDLLNYREANKLTNVAIIRLEQLYPLDEKRLLEAARPVPGKAQAHLVPGRAAKHGRVDLHLHGLDRLFAHTRQIWYAGRDAGASPAVGALAIHKTRAKGSDPGCLHALADSRSTHSAPPRTLSSIHRTQSMDVTIPAVGESITSGLISTWHKKDGETVQRGRRRC